MIRLFLGLALVAAFAGCSTPATAPNPSPGGVRIPDGFTSIPSRVPKEEWKRVFFRVARDVRLLPKLQPYIHDITITLLRDETENTLLFIAHARLTRNADQNFWKNQTRRLYEPEMAPDFVQIRHYPNRSLTESEAYLKGAQSAKTIIAVSDDRAGNVHLVGGSRPIGGGEPFALDRMVRAMTDALNR